MTLACESFEALRAEIEVISCCLDVWRTSSRRGSGSHRLLSFGISMIQVSPMGHAQSCIQTSHTYYILY